MVGEGDPILDVAVEFQWDGLSAKVDNLRRAFPPTSCFIKFTIRGFRALSHYISETAKGSVQSDRGSVPSFMGFYMESHMMPPCVRLLGNR